MERKSKLIVFIFTITFIYIFFHFRGSIDDFAPLQIGIIGETIDAGFLKERLMEITPGFYALGSELIIILGIDKICLLFSPIQLIPYTFIFFFLIYKISDNYFLACLITIVELITGDTGTQRIFFWPHGFGVILLFIFFILILSILDSKATSIWKYYLMIIISCISIVYMSYNNFVILLIFLLTLTFYLFNLDEAKLTISMSNQIRSNIYKLLFLSFTVGFGLMNVFYNIFFHAIRASDSFQLSGLDKFLAAYLSSGPINETFADIHISYPKVITYYGLMKYGILILSILIFLSIFLKSKELRYGILPIFVIISLISMVFYSLIRIYIGNTGLSALYYPGIFCIAWLYRRGESFKKWSLLAVCCLLILQPVYHYEIYSNDLSNRDANKFNYLYLPLLWIDEKTSNQLLCSDELTKDFYIMLYKSEGITSMDENDIKFLLEKQNFSANKYFIINDRLNVLFVGNWVELKSWKYSKNLLEQNVHISKVLETDEISIYSR